MNKPQKLKKREIGRTGLSVTPVGMGTLTMGFSQKNLSVQEGAHLIVHAIRSGINFLDTAQYYDTYRFLRPAMDEIRKDPGLAFPVLCSRTLETGYSGARAAVEECLNALDLPAVDLFLLHEVRGRRDLEERWEAWRALQDLKRVGRIRAIGISTHHVDACRGAARLPGCDAVFALINRAGLGIRNGEEAGSREEMEEAVRLCSEKGIGVFSMKAFGGGNLTGSYIPSLDYASHVPGNTSVMIGFSSEEEIDAAVSYFAGTLPENYQPDTSDKRMMVDQSDCEGCGTCIRRCTSHAIHWNENGLAEIDPVRCVRCGYCAPVCPVRAIIFL